MSGSDYRAVSVSVFTMPDGTEVTAAEAAELAAEALRALAHLTGKPAGLTYPSNVHGVLGSLSTAIARLPQSLAQMTLFLGRQHEAGHVVADWGPYAGHADAAVTDAAEAVAVAIAHANGLKDALDRAQRACSGLSYTGPDGDE